MRAHSITYEKSLYRNVTVNVGVNIPLARGNAESGVGARLARQDAVMYRAKREGRNRFVVLVE